jgi:predicted metal-dependent phosphoesterase TrpH
MESLDSCTINTNGWCMKSGYPKDSANLTATTGDDDRPALLFDMHVHSWYSSDSIIPVMSHVRLWERHRILPLVCDHNTIAGSVSVYRQIHAMNPEIPVIRAEEIMTADGEIIGAFLTEEIPPFMSAEATLDAIHEQGALAIVPHPFCSLRSSAIRSDVLDRIVHRVDIIEGFNGRIVDERDNDGARRYAARHGIPVSAGSDAHTLVELGRTYMVLEPFSSPEELIRGVRSAAIHYRRTPPAIHAVTRILQNAKKGGQDSLHGNLSVRTAMPCPKKSA